MSDTPDDVAYTSLTADQIVRYAPATRAGDRVRQGDVLFVEGDTNLDLYGWFGVVGVDPVEVQVF